MVRECEESNGESDAGSNCGYGWRTARPRQRVLALLDVENLLRRRPYESLEADYADAIARAAAICGIDRPLCSSHTVDVVIGVGNHNRVGLFAAANAWPTAALRCLGGRDGGELSLLRYAADLDAITRTYDRVVIGSGDGEFVDFTVDLGNRLVPTTVVSWRRKLSRRLARAASEVRLMDSRRVRVDRSEVMMPSVTAAA